MRRSTFLLGSVAVLLGTPALAADLPSKKAAPVEYVRVCSTHGEGFFYIPGTDTCLRIGGYVRAEYGYDEPLYNFPGNGRSVNATGFLARGRLNVDARTATEYGLLRTFLRYDITAASGVEGGPAAVLDKGFIQFGGLTAGRVQSFYDFYANDLNYGLGLGSDTTTQVLAYTATFGAGFSATLSIEDATARRAPLAIYGGTRMPDLVGALRVDQGWGSAQLSGVVHQINTPNRGFGGNSDTEYGYAIQGGVKVNLPTGAGDVLWLQASYADGAVSYAGGPVTALGVLTGTYATNYDFAYNGFGGIEKTKSYSFVAAGLHYWTPTIRQAVFGGYQKFEVWNSGAGFTTFALPGAAPVFALDTAVWQLGTNVIWSPVANFDIGVEVGYINVDPQARVIVAPAVSKGQEDQFYGRLRIQRDF